MTAIERRTQLIAAARELLETEGAKAITMRRLGAQLGIRGPSLYKHVTSKEEIEAALIIDGLAELADILEGVPRTFVDLAGAYRAWALEHPHLYWLLNRRPLPRASLPTGLEQRTAALLIDACGGDGDLARAAWATINGLIDLELADRLPPDADITAAYAAAARAYAGVRLGSLEPVEVEDAIQVP
ncbi:MAG: TetR/AcrR family transcriptional regulator [Acidimicrobiales bacterium]